MDSYGVSASKSSSPVPMREAPAASAAATGGRGHVEITREGLIVTLTRSKPDQEDRGRQVGIPYGSTPHTCPVRALRDWQAAAPYPYSGATLLNHWPGIDLAGMVPLWIIRWQNDAHARAEAEFSRSCCWYPTFGRF